MCGLTDTKPLNFEVTSRSSVIKTLFQKYCWTLRLNAWHNLKFFCKIWTNSVWCTKWGLLFCFISHQSSELLYSLFLNKFSMVYQMGFAILFHFPPFIRTSLFLNNYWAVACKAIVYGSIWGCILQSYMDFSCMVIWSLYNKSRWW